MKPSCTAISQHTPTAFLLISLAVIQEKKNIFRMAIPKFVIHFVGSKGCPVYTNGIVMAAIVLRVKCKVPQNCQSPKYGEQHPALVLRPHKQLGKINISVLFLLKNFITTLFSFSCGGALSLCLVNYLIS